MKEYRVKYEIKGIGYVAVMAENKDDAMNEIGSIFSEDAPTHEENGWITYDVLEDNMSWETMDTIGAEEV